jgi:ribosomal protein S18 acetylase RimI-like enzyme
MSDNVHFTRHLYRSGVSDKPLTRHNARMSIVSIEDLPRRPAFRGSIRFADLGNKADLKAVQAINDFYWGTMIQEVFGREYDVMDCDSLIAVPLPDEQGATGESNHGIAGNVAVYNEKEGFLHIVVLHVWPDWHGRGVGKRLVEAAVEQARSRGFTKIKLGTTNDNVPAIYFYQRAGFVLEKIEPYVVTDASEISPGGFAGIPVRDELIFRLDI